MKDPSKAYAGATQVGGPLDGVSQISEWRLAKAAHHDLRAMGMPRVNLLFIGKENVLRQVLETLFLDLRGPIFSWSPGEPLILPPAALIGTVILHDVGGLPIEDQRRLLKWIEHATGRTQVISTTSTSLLSQVQAGGFIDTLYYRLNTVCLDVTAQVA